MPGRPAMTEYRRRLRYHQAQWRRRTVTRSARNRSSPARGAGPTCRQPAPPRLRPGHRRQLPHRRRRWPPRERDRDRRAAPELRPPAAVGRPPVVGRAGFNLFGDLAADLARPTARCTRGGPTRRHGVRRPLRPLAGTTRPRLPQQPPRLRRGVRARRRRWGASGHRRRHELPRAQQGRAAEAEERRPQHGGVRSLGRVRPAARQLLGRSDLAEMWLEHLLLHSMLQHESGMWMWGRYVVVYPAGNVDLTDAVAATAPSSQIDATYATITVEEAARLSRPSRGDDEGATRALPAGLIGAARGRRRPQLGVSDDEAGRRSVDGDRTRERRARCQREPPRRPGPGRSSRALGRWSWPAPGSAPTTCRSPSERPRTRGAPRARRSSSRPPTRPATRCPCPTRSRSGAAPPRRSTSRPTSPSGRIPGRLPAHGHHAHRVGGCRRARCGRVRRRGRRGEGRLPGQQGADGRRHLSRGQAVGAAGADIGGRTAWWGGGIPGRAGDEAARRRGRRRRGLARASSPTSFRAGPTSRSGGPRPWDRQRIFRLGRDLVVRLPRIGWAVPQIAKEFELLRLAPHLPAAVPEPMAGGAPGRGIRTRGSCPAGRPARTRSPARSRLVPAGRGGGRLRRRAPAGGDGGPRAGVAPGC